MRQSCCFIRHSHIPHSGNTRLSNSLFFCYNMMLSYTPWLICRVPPSLSLLGPQVGLQQKLGQLGSLARSSLAHQHHRLIALDELQEFLPAVTKKGWIPGSIAMINRVDLPLLSSGFWTISQYLGPNLLRKPSKWVSQGPVHPGQWLLASQAGSFCRFSKMS